MKKRIFGGMAALSALAAAVVLALGWAAAMFELPLFWLAAGSAATLAVVLIVASAVSSRITRRVLRPLEELAERPDLGDASPQIVGYPEMIPLLEKLRERQRALRRQVEELTEERDALRVITGNMQKELKRQRQEFSSNADRLRPLIAALSGLGERMQSDGLSAGDANSLGEAVVREASRMSALLDDMLRLSRLDGETPALMTRVSLSAVCRETLTSLSLMAHRHGVGLKLIGPEVWTKGDAEMLGELMTALCENAIQYNHRDGSVLVETGAGADGTVWVAVRDTGVGIPEGSFQRIFDRFYQVEEGRLQQDPGTGLGLSIAKRLADFHRGSIAVESSLGQGSVFTVTLPAWQEEASSAAAKEPAAVG